MNNYAKKTICIDLDGTLAKYDHWRGIHHIGDPFPFAKEWLEDVSQRYRIVIHTCRTNLINAKDMNTPDESRVKYLASLVKNWFDQHDLPYDEVWCGPGKPMAEYYVDDRAIKVKNGIYPEV